MLYSIVVLHNKYLKCELNFIIKKNLIASKLFCLKVVIVNKEHVLLTD